MRVTGAGHSESASKHPHLVPVISPLIWVNPVSFRGVEMIGGLVLLIGKLIDGQKGTFAECLVSRVLGEALVIHSYDHILWVVFFTTIG